MKCPKCGMEMILKRLRIRTDVKGDGFITTVWHDSYEKALEYTKQILNGNGARLFVEWRLD